MRSGAYQLSVVDGSNVVARAVIVDGERNSKFEPQRLQMTRWELQVLDPNSEGDLAMLAIPLDVLADLLKIAGWKIQK